MSLKKLYKMPGHLIRRCQQISVAIFLEECGDYQLRSVEYAVLVAVEDLPGLDQITLSGLVAVDRSSIVRIVEGLEKRGLLTREPRPADRRTRCLKLTEAGKALLEDVGPAVERVQRRLLAPLNSGERKQFKQMLEKITNTNNQLSRVPMRTVK